MGIIAWTERGAPKYCSASCARSCSNMATVTEWFRAVNYRIANLDRKKPIDIGPLPTRCCKTIPGNCSYVCPTKPVGEIQVADGRRALQNKILFKSKEKVAVHRNSK